MKTKTVELSIPERLSHGRGGSFKKGIIDILRETEASSLDETPEGHEKAREAGREFGRELVKKIAKIVAK